MRLTRLTTTRLLTASSSALLYHLVTTLSITIIKRWSNSNSNSSSCCGGGGSIIIIGLANGFYPIIHNHRQRNFPIVPIRTISSHTLLNFSSSIPPICGTTSLSSSSRTSSSTISMAMNTRKSSMRRRSSSSTNNDNTAHYRDNIDSPNKDVGTSTTMGGLGGGSSSSPEKVLTTRTSTTATTPTATSTSATTTMMKRTRVVGSNKKKVEEDGDNEESPTQTKKARKVNTRTGVTSTTTKVDCVVSHPSSSSQKDGNKKETTTTTSASSSSSDDGGQQGQPWYTQFTKGDEEYEEYMRTEWGFERRGDESMFEKLCLEGAQSGLSWLTILRKRDAYRKTFYNFDVDKVASMTPDDIQAILDTPTDTKKTKKAGGNNNNNSNTRDVIVRHRGKIEAVINNAKCIQQMRISANKTDEFVNGEYGVFDTFLWNFVENKPILNTWWDGSKQLSDAPGRSIESEMMSKALKKLGFKFVGPTTCYAMMQSEGMVIDHPVNSPEWVAALKRLQQRPGGYQERDKKS